MDEECSRVLPYGVFFYVESRATGSITTGMMDACARMIGRNLYIKKDSDAIDNSLLSKIACGEF